MTEQRRRRVQRLKRYIIILLLLVLITPTILCIVLFIRLYHLDRTLDMLSMQVNHLTWSAVEQRELLGELMEEVQTAGEGESTVHETVNGQEQVKIEELSEPVEAQQTPHEPAHKVYLTFDDGPSIYTEDILAILDRYDVKATFFVVGKESDQAKESLSMIVDGGHTLGMHSYSHKYSQLYQSVEDFADDFVKLQSFLYDVTGVESKVYRFPGGSSNTVSNIDMQEFADYLEGQGVQFYDWNISSGDGGSILLPVNTLVKNCTEDIPNQDISIILLHDSADKRTTVEALPIIIEDILAMEDTVLLPITEDTVPVQHIH